MTNNPVLNVWLGSSSASVITTIQSVKNEVPRGYIVRVAKHSMGHTQIAFVVLSVQ
jgi:hypothetical protein